MTCISARGQQQPLDVSIIQLIARPQDYDGKFVRLIGFVNLEFEGTVICLHEEDCRHSIMNNCLWLDATDEILRKRSDYHRKYVLIEGIFSAKDKGHLGAYQGSIQRISRWYVWHNESEWNVFYLVGGALIMLVIATIFLFRLRQGRRR